MQNPQSDKPEANQPASQPNQPNPANLPGNQPPPAPAGQGNRPPQSQAAPAGPVNRPPQAPPPGVGPALQPPVLFNPPRPHHKIETGREERERTRALIYCLMVILVLIVIGLIAGFLDVWLLNKDVGGNLFITNSRYVLEVIASSAPLMIVFVIIAAVWAYIANRMFVSWNSTMSSGEDDEAHGKGIIYEIVRDNNAAAAIVLIMPIMVIALVLIYIAIVNK